MLVALLITGFISCKNSTTQTNTPAMPKTIASDEIYTCKMHNDVMSDKPGKCPECGMTLVKQKITDEQKKMMKEGTYIQPKD
jgi:hypothetical protein